MSFVCFLCPFLVAGCDNIIVLESGRLVEQGSHQSLISDDSKYAEMWAMQATT
jgi:ATP-binding cassette, subfamily C, bacteriocin exporter